MTTETRSSSVNGTGTKVQRPQVEDLGLNLGKLTRLRRMLYGRGARNGTALFLPIDQGLEHGPRDFFPNPDSLDPDYEWRLARDGNYTAIALQIGLARKYLRDYAGEVPVVVKLNGKTDIPPDDEPISPLHTSVEEAIALGADAVGYTLYVGSPRQDEDFLQFGEVRREAERLGMPVIVWAYPRGAAVERKGGKNSAYAIEYAARVACELGADIVKVNMPEALAAEKQAAQQKPYPDLQYNMLENFVRVVRSAGRTPVLLSGGERVEDATLLRTAETALQAGATGFIFGRNVWQRPQADAVAITNRLWELLAKY